MAAACQPDKDISKWLIEFLLRQPIPVSLLERIIAELDASVVDSDWRLKKMLTLRVLQSRISKGSVSEKTLDSLELVERLDRENGNPIAESMKTAYCAVALECTAKGTYFDRVQSIWRGRVQNLENLGKCELLTDELKKVRDDAEAAVWDQNVYERLLESSKGIDASHVVEAYLEEAMAASEPSFLEVAARRERELKEKAQCSGQDREGSPRVEVDDSLGSGAEDGMDVASEQLPDGGGQPIDGSSAAEVKKKGYRRVKRLVTRKHTTRQGRLTGGKPTSKYDTLSTAEVKQVQGALRSCSAELQAAVTDPLPDAMHRSQSLIAQAPQSKETSVENQGVPESQINKELGSSMHQNVTKPSLMARNSTASTYKWDDSIDRSSEETPNSDRRIVLRNPQRGAVLPLPKNDGINNPPRRKKRRWSVEEEDALREGVDEFGRGHWKAILNSRKHVFVERSEVDLKDKWRNMTAHG